MFEERITKEICRLISNYCSEYPEAPRSGSSFVITNANAQFAAVVLVEDIMNIFAEEYKEEQKMYE